MNEELKAILGDSYHNGITLEEVGDFFKGKKFADLSSGKYVDKDKYTTQINSLNQKLNDKENELNSKLTDDEKAKKIAKEQEKRIQELESLLQQNTINSNKNVVNSKLQSARELLDIKVEDESFTSFIEGITTDNAEKSNEIADYVSKLVKDAYEKGKKDMTKDKLGDFGKANIVGSSEKTHKAENDLGARLAASVSSNIPKNSYFGN